MGEKHTLHDTTKNSVLMREMTRLKEFGVWSEQTSSSGKRYYYNRETEVSQWEKPTEWKEHEKALMEKYKLSRTSSKMNLSKSSSSSSSAKPLTSDPNPHASSSSTVHASLSSTPTPKHHNSSLSGVRASSSSASNLVSGSQSSVQKSRTSDGLKRPRDDDRHHHHSSSKSSYLDPFAAPQNLTISNERSRTVGDKSERIISTNGFSTRQPSSSTRPSVSGCSGETNVHTPTSSMSSSKHHSAALFPSSNQRPPAISAANSVMPSPHCSTPKSRLPEGLKRLRDDDHHHHQSSGKEMPSTPQASSSNERSVTRSSTTVEKSTEKPVVLNALPIFNEAKYLSLYRTDLTSHRRNWSSHAYTNEARRCAEKNAKQATVLNAIDDDVRSVRSLMKAAELRCSLLDQRLTFIRGQIANLEAKNPPA